MTDVHPNTRYQTEGKKLTGTTKTACLVTGAGSYMEVTGGTVCASAGSAGNLTVYWYDASTDTEFTVAYEVEVPAVGNLRLAFDPVHMDPADEIRLAGENNMHVILSYIGAGRNLGIR